MTARGSTLAGLFGLVSLAASIASGATIEVRPGVSALADAVARAVEGDTLALAPGIYREHVHIDKRLTLRGQASAVLDGSEELRATWSPAGDAVFSTSVKKRHYGLLVDGKFVAEVRSDRAQGKGDWHWKTLLAKGPPLSGFTQIRALWMYDPETNRIHAHFENGAAPDGLALSWLRSDAPLLTIAGAKGVVVEGLTFAHGFQAITVTDHAAEAVVRGCKITSYEDTGIVLTGGAARCTIEDCEITRGSYEDWQPSQEHDRANYEIWRIHKDVGRYDRVGIDIVRAGAGNRILRNHLDRVFDGICIGDSSCESLDKPLIDPDHGRGTEIAENVIENTRDSGIELGVGCIEVNVHHNTLRRTHGGLRFKAPRIGPVFIHHNRLIDGAPFNMWFSMDASPAEGFVYHNTIVGGHSAALQFFSFNTHRNFGAPKWRFINNLVLGKEPFFERGDRTPKPDFTAEHNVVTATIPSESGRTAIDAGMDLSTYLGGKPLPGCEPGYFQDKAPDAGADEQQGH
ncbi:MAG: right-handed parallel beta-helix repeat-containing protein [Chthoniobacter sp.]|uniref:right-handed parallel beta-helix repeat-containing protein n=1 Tax=Chthoniobacter sp. TaxID=2510640 RepID=UPI0032AB71BF